MITIDSDGHLHEPFDLFDRYLEREYWSRRPRIVRIEDHPYDEGRWLFEGQIVPRVPFTPGVGGGGMQYMRPRHPQMQARDMTLDDVPGRLADMDALGIDVQVVFPTALVWVLDVADHDLATALCRAYNNYVAEQCRQAPERLKGVALVPLQDPVAAAEEARRAVRELGHAAVLVPGMVGNETLDLPKFEPFFETIAALDVPLGLHAVTGMHYTPWGDCFRDFLSTHTTVMPFSMMVGVVSLLRAGYFERFPTFRAAFLEIGASWLLYWSWWVGKHVADRAERGFAAPPMLQEWGGEPYEVAPTRPPLEYLREGRMLSGYEPDEDLRYIVDKLGAGCLMYASDYPHGDMSWTKVPETRENPTLTDAEKDAILGGNAARFYQFPVAGSLIGQGAAAVSRAG
jgi:uncharacterized protein